MVMQKFTIAGRLPGLNDYTKACRSNRFAGAKMKEEAEEQILWFTQRLNPVNNKVIIHYHWIEENRKRDLDNVAFAKKFIQDALVKGGVLQSDGWKGICGFTDDFSIDKENPRIEVVIEEVK